VLITGAGSGIGRTMALAFAAEGALVAVNDLAPERVEETVALVATQGGQALAAPADVSSLAAVTGMVASLAERGMAVDVLVNNAAIVLASAPFLETRPEDCEREIQVILLGTMHCTRAVLPAMVERRSGKIVNIVTDAARVGQEREVSYSAAKGGVLSFTRSIAREMGRHNINVNAVSPAATDTPLRRGLLQKLAERIGEAAVEEREAKIRRAYPLRRIGAAEDVSDAVLFLASERARHVTGQVLGVNGGFAML
jgi:2-hydroxycyclohexanecarboxyl-CoA dehydrogenase